MTPVDVDVLGRTGLPMDFEIFTTKLEVLDNVEGDELRKKYIKKFVNTDHELYQDQIQSKHKFLDGYCYLGYLWDYIKNPVIIEKEYLEAMAGKINKVYVFWDIHSCERIFVKDYWKFIRMRFLRWSLKCYCLKSGKI